MFSLASVCLFMGGGPRVVEGPVQTCSLGDPLTPTNQLESGQLAFDRNGR